MSSSVKRHGPCLVAGTMKVSQALILLSAFALLPACGELKSLKSEKQTPPAEMVRTSQAQTWGGDLAAGCKSRQGQMSADGSLCTISGLSKALAGGKLGTSEEMTSIEIGDVPAGAAILITGRASNNSVEVTLDDAPVSAVPSPNNQPIVMERAGKLAFKLMPGGTFREVRAYTYLCVDRTFETVRCKF
jgi:hypothetical protein